MTDAKPVATVAAPGVAPERKLWPTWALVAVGASTLALLALTLVAWIDVHVEVWAAAARCQGSFYATAWTRGLASLLGGGSLGGLSISSLWLGVHPDDRRARRLFWAAIVLAWLAISAMGSSTAHETSECVL